MDLLNRGKRSFVQEQIQWVTHSLRKTGKWNKSLAKFQELKDQLCASTDVDKIDRKKILEPFLHVIASKKSGWSLTKVALNAINNLIEHGFLLSTDPSSAEVVNTIFETVLQSKFADVTRLDAEEMTEISILRVLCSCIRCSVGSFVKPNLILDMIQVGFQLVTQSRKTEMYQDAAEKVLKQIVCSICDSTLSQYIQSQRRNSTETTEDLSSSKIEFSSQQILLVHAILKSLTKILHNSLNPPSPQMKPPQTQSDYAQDIALQVFMNLLNSFISDVENFPPLILDIIKDDLCRYILEALKSPNILIFSRVCRMYYNLFLCLRSQIKLQTELFFKTLITKILESKDKKYTEHQEAALEIIVEFCSEPNFITDLYVNFDCDLYCGNVFEILCRYLYKNAFPVSGALTSKHLLSLDGLHGIIHSIVQCSSTHEGVDVVGPPPPVSISPSQASPKISTRVEPSVLSYTISEQTPPKMLRDLKQVKQILITAIEKFNTESVDSSFKFLQENGLLPTPLEPTAVAQLFRSTPGLNKKTVGAYFGEPEDFNIAALRSYISAFVVEYHSEHYSSLVSTVRAFMESFRLPGEAQKISRIFENFGQIYYDYHSKRPDLSPGEFPFESPDGIFVMCFSIAMLNTDQHSAHVKNKMTLEDYMKMARDTQYTKDLTKELVENIYYSIKNSEIKIPEENPDDSINANVWQNLLRRSKKTTFVNTSECQDLVSVCNRDIFSVIWGPLIAALSVVFDTTFDEPIIQKALAGFKNCALIAAHYNMNQVFDNLVISICKFSALSTLYSTTDRANQLINFSLNTKAHLACYALFEIIKAHGSHLREGWKNILDCLIAIYKANLLVNFVEIPDYLKLEIQEPKTNQPKEEASYLLNPIGYFLDYSSWWASTPEKPVIQGNEAENTVKEVIAKLNIKELVEGTKTLHADSLVYLVKAIILASSKSSSQLKVAMEKSDIVLYLDLVTSIALQNQDRINLIWSLENDYFSSLISAASGNLQKKAIGNLMLLCDSLLSKKDITEQVMRSLEIIHRLPEAKRSEQTNERIAFGITKLLESNAKYIKSRPCWAILISFLEFPSNSQNILVPSTRFKALQYLIAPSETSQLSYVCNENFEYCLNCLTPYTKWSNTDISLKAIQLLYTMFDRVKELYGFDTQSKSKFDDDKFAKVDEAWRECWKPVLSVLYGLCRVSNPTIREAAFVELQRSALSNNMYILYPAHWTIFFDKILFPLLSEHINPKEIGNFERPEQLELLRLHSIQLLSKVFLQHLPTLGLLPWAEFKALWMKILHIISMYMNESSVNLKDALKESLKNILLVMSVSGLFKRSSPASPSEDRNSSPNDPQFQQEQDLWELSWSWINAVCPSLQEELMAPVTANPVSLSANVVGPSSPGINVHQIVREVQQTQNMANQQLKDPSVLQN